MIASEIISINSGISYPHKNDDTVKAGVKEMRNGVNRLDSFLIYTPKCVQDFFDNLFKMWEEQDEINPQRTFIATLITDLILFSLILYVSPLFFAIFFSAITITVISLAILTRKFN